MKSLIDCSPTGMKPCKHYTWQHHGGGDLNFGIYGRKYGFNCGNYGHITYMKTTATMETTTTTAAIETTGDSN